MYSFVDVRVNDYHTVNVSSHRWSTDWTEFPGLTTTWQVDMLPMERRGEILDFFHHRWHTSVAISCVYLAIIFGLKRFMRDRQPMNLRWQLAAWNFLLTVFSVYGTVRCLPEFLYMLSTRGFRASFCESTYFNDFRLVSWYLYFISSKAFELGDTIFVVLRKQRLYRLHWIHHILTLCYCWFVFADIPGTARWMVNMNFFVHSVMYAYYTLRAMRFKIPKPLALSITTMQIVQMLFGFYINLMAFHYKMSGSACDLSRSVAITGLSLYSLFFGLFVNFFVRSYIIPLLSKKRMVLKSDYNQNFIYNKKQAITAHTAQQEADLKKES